MRLVIVSGVSGAGKSIALHALEDDGFYCIDNLPVVLMLELVEKITRGELDLDDNVAVSMDIRSLGKAPAFGIASMLDRLRKEEVETTVIFLEADENTLLRRYSEARRPHPLAFKSTTIKKAIGLERACLDEVLTHTDLRIDTTELNQWQLGEHLRSRLRLGDKKLPVLIQSFGYKKGVPLDSDFVFDVRCLPNPHWRPELREMTGRDERVIGFLEADPGCDALFKQIRTFVEDWLERFGKTPKACLTLSIGCTGGQHRSVYIAERLYAAMAGSKEYRVSKNHRELP